MDSTKILVVDDQPEITENLEKRLSTEGFFVKIAHNFTEGLFLIENDSFDIAVLDIALMDGNGIDLYRALRKRNNDIYTIMITGNATIENAITALNEGVNAYLIKPFSDQQLKGALFQAEKTLRLKSENRDLFQKIEQNKQFYEDLLNSTSEAIFVVDPGFTIKYANRAACEMMQTPEGFLGNQSLQELIEDGYKVLTHIHQQLLQGKPVAGFRVSILPASQKIFNAHLNADFLHGKNQHIDGIIINLSNPLIHDEVLHRILRKEKLATIVHLANSLSHEIRNPINILYGRMQLLKEEIKDQNFNKAFSSIQRQIERMLNITELLGKFDASKEDSVPEQCDITSIFETILEEKNTQFSQKEIEIDYVGGGHSVMVEGNPIQFSDAFRYLLDALSELTPAGKKLEILAKGTSHHSHSAGFEFQIIIPGIKLSTDQLFEPYQSLDMEMNGLLGLSMVIMHTIFSNYGASVESFIQNESRTLIRIRFPEIKEKITKQERGSKKKKSVPKKVSKRGEI